MKKTRDGNLDTAGLIRKYLENRLSESERLVFEQLRNTDQDLEVEIKLVRSLLLLEEEPALAQAGTLLLALRESTLNPIPAPASVTDHLPEFLRYRSTTFWGITIGLVAALVVLLVVIIKSPSSSVDDDLPYKREDLFTDHLIVYPSILELPDPSDKLFIAVQAFQDSTWDLAATEFKKFAEEDLVYEFHYLVASLNISKKNKRAYKKDKIALQQLKQELIEDDEILHRRLLEWIDYYIALIDIKQDDYKAGRRHILSVQLDSMQLERILQEEIDALILKLQRNGHDPREN